MIASILGFIYAVGQVLVPCLPPVPLSREVLTDQYLGKWHYIGVASWYQKDIADFQAVDSAQVELKNVNDNLVMTGALREGADCVNKAWTYKPEPELDYIMDENGHLGVAWDGKWLNCPSCLILGKLHPDAAFIRFMLFARTEKTTELVESFKTKMGCFGIDKFIIAPETKALCKLEGTD
ncbi:uncharacterized protein LOC143477932 [Brachyhypopomus gauderio]|uniref:uncharacterized protein LOC143477932 n=1 Tax=Brachyhypopomus gauderio TaxID=698409 RepID=UPI004041EE50